jgi:hypothetical protein
MRDKWVQLGAELACVRSADIDLVCGVVEAELHGFLTFDVAFFHIAEQEDFDLLGHHKLLMAAGAVPAGE